MAGVTLAPEHFRHGLIDHQPAGIIECRPPCAPWLVARPSQDFHASPHGVAARQSRRSRVRNGPCPVCQTPARGPAAHAAGRSLNQSGGRGRRRTEAMASATIFSVRAVVFGSCFPPANKAETSTGDSGLRLGFAFIRETPASRLRPRPATRRSARRRARRCRRWFVSPHGL